MSIAGIRNSHMREHLVHAIVTAAAPVTVYTGNARVIFAAAARDRLRLLAASPVLSVSTEMSRLRVDRLRLGRNAMGCVAWVWACGVWTQP